MLRVEQKHSGERRPGTKLQGALPSLGSGRPFLRNDANAKIRRLGRSRLWGPRGLRVPRLGVRRWEGRWQGWSPGPCLASLVQWHGSEHALALGGHVSFVSPCH